MARERDDKSRPKGLAKARRGATLRVRRGESLTREAEERLFHHAEVISEGSVRESRGVVSYFGSTMITCDLDDLRTAWRGPLDAEARERLARAVEGSVRVRLRIMRLAYAEVARRIPDRPLGTAQVETRVRLEGDRLLVDLGGEVPIGVSSRRRV